MEKMSYEQFKLELTSCIRKKLKKEKDERELIVSHSAEEEDGTDMMYLHGNGEDVTFITGVSIRELYRFSRRGQTVGALAESFLCSGPADAHDPLLVMLRDYETARNSLFIRVRSADDLKNTLPEVPYRQVEDLVITAHLKIRSDDNSLSSTIVTNQMAETFGIPAEKVLQDAVENSSRMYPVKIRKISEILDDFDIEPFEDNMLVVTSTFGINGAAALFYPGVMETIGEMMKEDYYVLPCSLHEVIIAPEGIRPLACLRETVHNINRTIVETRDILSNNVYHYSCSRRRLEIAEEDETRSITDLS